MLARGQKITALFMAYKAPADEMQQEEQFWSFGFNPLPSPYEDEPSLTHLRLKSIVHDMASDKYRLNLAAVKVHPSFHERLRADHEVAEKALKHPKYTEFMAKAARAAADGTWTPGQAEGRREADGSYTPAWHVHSQEMTRAAEESMARASIDDQD